MEVPVVFFLKFPLWIQSVLGNRGEDGIFQDATILHQDVNRTITRH